MLKVPKIAISLEYLKKEERDEVDVLHADKHQVDTIYRDGDGQPCPNYQSNEFAKSL